MYWERKLKDAGWYFYEKIFFGSVNTLEKVHF